MSTTKSLLISSLIKLRKKHSFEVFIIGQQLVQSRSTKYLGVIIDDKLSWKDHITYLKSKLSRNCYAIGKLKQYVGISTLKLVYYSLFYSYLQYCITSWGGAAKSNLDPFNKVHERVVHYISQMPALSPTNPLFPVCCIALSSLCMLAASVFYC